MSCCIHDDAPAFWSTVWAKARKQYRCCECHAEIQIGDLYERHKQMFEGKFFEYKTCEACADLRDSLMQVWCTYMENLRDDYIEFCDNTGRFSWSEDGEKIIYPENHLRLNR